MVHCAVQRLPHKFSPQSFGILYPEGARPGFLGAMFNSYLFPHLAPQDKQLVSLGCGGVGAEGELLLPPDQVILDVCRRQLGVDSVIILAKHCWHQAIPQYEPGQLAFVASVEALEREFAGLTMAGVDRGGVGVPDRIKSVMELLGHV